MAWHPHGLHSAPFILFFSHVLPANVSFWPVNIFAFFFFFFLHIFSTRFAFCATAAKIPRISSLLHFFFFFCFISVARGGAGPWIYGLWHKVGSNRDRNKYIFPYNMQHMNSKRLQKEAEASAKLTRSEFFHLMEEFLPENYYLRAYHIRLVGYWPRAC